MTQWALEHPYLTAFLILCAIMAVESIGVAVAEAFKTRKDKEDAN